MLISPDNSHKCEKNVLNIFPIFNTSPISQMLHQANSHSAQCGNYPQVEDFRPSIQSVMVQHGQLTTINQSQLSSHLGLSGNGGPHNSPSPPGSKRASPSPSSSVQEDDADEGLKVTIEIRGVISVKGLQVSKQ